MKICPRCQKTYNDDGLNFCLDDGATLQQANDAAIPPTVVFNQARPTDPQQFANQTAASNNWGGANPVSIQQQPKKSKTWLWVLAVLGGLILVCGGGFAGFVYWAANLDTNNNNSGAKNYNSNVKNSSPANSNVKIPAGKTTEQKIDLSEWVKGDTSLGVTEYKNDEFFMSSKKKGYYYVLAAPAKYQTENAVTKVSVRNVNEQDTNLGFGLVVNSNPIPLTQDYAFLIDSEDKKYRVVRHVPQDEITVVGWTNSSAIKDGTETNVLEVRDENKKMNFYINGELVKTVNNTDGYSGGVAGIYTSDALQIAFSDLKIAK